MEVVRQEPDGGAAGGRDDRQCRVDAVRRRQQRECAKRREHHSRRQPVEAVDEVDGVDDQDDPGHCQRQREHAEADGPPRQLEVLDAEPQREGEDCGRNLPEELDQRAHAAHVVDDANHDEQERPGQDRGGSVWAQESDRVEVFGRDRREADGHRERDRDRHAAQPRDRELVDLALGVRLVEQALPVGDLAHDRGDQQAHDEGHGGGEGGQHRPRW